MATYPDEDDAMEQTATISFFFYTTHSTRHGLTNCLLIHKLEHERSAQWPGRTAARQLELEPTAARQIGGRGGWDLVSRPGWGSWRPDRAAGGRIKAGAAGDGTSLTRSEPDSTQDSSDLTQILGWISSKTSGNEHGSMGRGTDRNDPRRQENAWSCSVRELNLKL
jgi:hypothetical protein